MGIRLRALLAAVAVATIALSSLAVVPTAHAFDFRPGGGQSFSSGGGHSSGSSGFGSGSSHSSGFGSGSSSGFGSGSSSGFGSGSSSGFSTGTAGSTSSTPGSGGANPLGAFVLLFVVGFVVVIVLGVWIFRGPTASVQSAINTVQYDADASRKRSASLDPIRAHDPTISEESITERVRHMSGVLRDAWCNGDMRPARAFVSDGVYNRFGVQLELMQHEGTRNVMADAKTLYCTLEVVESHPPLDVVSVRFTAEAKDVTVPRTAPQGEIDRQLRGARVEPYTEIWTLVRKVGAQSKLRPDQVGVNCPSCGAPLGEGAVAQCKYCKALVCSGEHDWVLSEITQISEWAPSSYEEVRGMEALRQADPALTREVLEDRASLVFWKWIAAAQLRTLAPLKKVASPSVLANPHTESAAGATTIAVGAADTLLVDPGDDGDVDHVFVKIYWSAAFAANASPTPMQSVLRLARKAGLKSKLSMAVTCGTCGAPLTATDSTKCDHCGTDLSAAMGDWVLDGVVMPNDVRPRAHAAEGAIPEWLIPRVDDPRDRELLFGQMAALMSADGVLAKPEQRLLRECARRWAIPEEKAQWILARPPVFGAARPQNPEWFLAGLVSAAMVDGKLDASERVMLQRARAALNVPPALLEQQLQAAAAQVSRGGR